MRFDKVLIGLEVQLSEKSFNRYLPSSVSVIGKALADVALAFEKENKTGYFPAIDFLKTQEAVDKGLIESAEQVAWLSSKLARENIQKQLQAIFSSVHFQTVQTVAFSMPKARPNQSDVMAQLLAHYTPDTLKIELVLTMMRRDSDKDDGRAEPYARKMMFRWLESVFETVKVTNSKTL